MMKARHALALCLLTATGGFIVGRLPGGPVPETVTLVEYLPGYTVYLRDATPALANERPALRDTALWQPAAADSSRVDTLESLRATARDWSAERTYTGQLLESDTLGVATYTARVQYNRLTSLEAVYAPVTRQVTTTTRAKYFALGSANSLGQISAGAGVQLKNNLGVFSQITYDAARGKTGVSVGFIRHF